MKRDDALPGMAKPRDWEGARLGEEAASADC